MRVKAVLFDLGGTLWASFGSLGRDAVWTLASDAAVRRLEAKGICRPENGLAGRLASSITSRLPSSNVDPNSLYREDSDLKEPDFDTVFRDSVQALGITLTQEDVLSMSRDFQMDVESHYEVFPDALPCLRLLKETYPAVRVGIVSNTCICREVIEFHLAAAGILELTDFRIFSSAVGWRKPHPSIYAEALRCSGVASKDAVFVGDKLVEDVIGPKCMGMKAFLRRLPTGETSMGGSDIPSHSVAGETSMGRSESKPLSSQDPPVYDGVIFDLSTIIEVLKAI